jgi:hypothetical protein
MTKKSGVVGDRARGGRRGFDVVPTAAATKAATVTHGSPPSCMTRKIGFKKKEEKIMSSPDSSDGEDEDSSSSTTTQDDDESCTVAPPPPEGLTRVLKEFVPATTTKTSTIGTTPAATSTISNNDTTHPQSDEDQPPPQERDDKDSTTHGGGSSFSPISGYSPRGAAAEAGGAAGVAALGVPGGAAGGFRGPPPTPSSSLMKPPMVKMRYDDHADGDHMILHSIDSELESFDTEYRRQRQMLELKVKEHEHNYLTRSQFVQGKLAEALEKTKKAGDVKLAMAQDAWAKQLNDAVGATHKRLEQERQDRLDEIAGLEATIQEKMRLLDEYNQEHTSQRESFVAAETDRATLKQEVKNILVTLHFQFENLTNQLSKQEDELREFERIQRNAVAQVESSVQEVTSYVDNVQHEVSQVQLENKALWKQCEDEQNTAREVLGQAMSELVAQTKTELSARFDEYGVQYKAMEGSIVDRATAFETDLLRRVAAMAGEMSTYEEKAKMARSKMSKECALRIQETEDTIFQSIDVHMAHMENQQREMQGKVAAQGRKSDDIAAVVSKMAEDFIEMDARKHREIDGVFAQVNHTLTEHATVATKLGSQIATTAERSSERFEQVCDRLEALEKALTTERSERIADKTTFEALTRDQLSCIKSLQEKLSEATEYSEALFERMLKVQKSHAELQARHEALQKKHESLEGSHYVLERNFETHLSETRQTENNVQAYMTQTDESIEKIESACSQLSREAKVRSETLVMATKEFRTGLAHVSDRFAGVDRRHGDVLKQLTHQEITLSAINVPELVEESVKPIIKTNDALAAQLAVTAEELSKVRDDIQTEQALHEVFDARLAEVKKTSESLFQHLASSVQSSQTETRDEVQALKSSLESIEAKIEDSLSKSSGAGLDTTVNEHTVSLRAVQAKVDSLADEVQTSVSRIGSRLTEYKQLREELAKDQFAMKDKVTRSIDNLVQWKREIESTVNEGKETLARELSSQQDAADKQVAKMIMQVSKEEQNSLHSAIDAKLERWSKKVENHSLEVEERINKLVETVDLLKKDMSFGQDERSINELRELADTLSKQIGQTSDKDLPGQPRQARFLMDAVDELRSDMINRNSMVLDLDNRVNRWITETGETLNQLGNVIQRQFTGRGGDADNEADAAWMMSKTKEVSELKAKLQDTSIKLKECRYECRGLRVKLLQKHSDDENSKCASL